MHYLGAALIGIFTLASFAADNAAIPYRKYASASETWPLITSRYRKDTEEIRLVYGNRAAVKALSEGRHEFPDGTVFVKYGYATADDPLFASSAVPQGVRRMQVMVRDSRKYADTDGWGYALFIGDKVSPEWNEHAAKACMACHRLAASRGEVFSELLNAKAALRSSAFGKALEFRKVGLGAIDPARAEAKELIAGISNSWSRLHGEMNKFNISGTFNELLPALISEAKRSGLPAGFLPENSSYFLMVGRVPGTPSVKCGKNENAFAVAKRSSRTYQKNNRHGVRRFEVCG
jgi:hypothetical protein